MGDREWSVSGCGRTDVWWYGIPGSGCHYWTERYGQYWVGGGLYQTYARQNWECGGLGAPVKAYGYMSEFNAYGQWFEYGGIYYVSSAWRVTLGNYGQTSGRLMELPQFPPLDAEEPPETEVPGTPPVAPPATAVMRG